MKKIIAALTALALCGGMVMGFSGCSEEPADTTVSSGESNTVSESDVSNESNLTDESDNNNQSGGTGGENDRPSEIRDITSVELVSEMKAGWNLGNTLDAGYEGVRGSDPITIETSWGNPATTKEMIDAVKEQGFNVLRVPVTWEWSTGEGPNYIISEEWMDRVQEVVNYGIDNDMFVILNVHHESWHDPYEDNYEAASDRLKKVWTQIGERFQNYDEHLIFEGMNEPRLRNTDDEWNGGTEAAREVVNKLNADFAETIRSLGGNNPLRHLMIPGYAASSYSATLSDLKIPDDDKVIVSVHGYIPYKFALATGSGANKYFVASRSGQTTDIDNLADTLKTMFIDKGQAVIIGEFGAINRDNDPFRVHWVKYYVTKMTEIGVPCVWWDNNANSGSGELFGLFNRRTLEWYSQDVADAFIAAANGEFTMDELMAESDELLASINKS